MSKWCSARFRAAALGLVAVALAACSQDEGQSGTNPGSRSSVVTEPELAVDAVPQEVPGLARQRWRAANENARDVAGNLTVSLEEGRGGPLALAFANGITLRGEERAVHEGSVRINADGATFRSLLGLSPQVQTRVYRIVEETVTLSAQQGLCGDNRTTTIAASEFVDERGRWVLRLAAFRGSVAPGEGRVNPDLCGVFAYESQ
ncbi:MAG: hypothetical protein AB7J28_00980 [Hyphomonadaceae bacterium]